MKRLVMHVDGITKVWAKVRIIGEEFVGEYKYRGFTMLRITYKQINIIESILCKNLLQGI